MEACFFISIDFYYIYGILGLNLFMNMNTPLKIAIIEENDGTLRAMVGIIARYFPVYVSGVLVSPECGYPFVVSRIRELRPDIILVADPLTETLDTRVFLVILSDHFHKANEGIAGNPRVISTSGNSASEITKLIGGLFERKGDLLSQSPEVRADAERNLVEVMKYAFERFTP